MRAELVDLDTLTALPRNPKDHDLGAIHTSVGRWGFLERIVINEVTGHILSGHGRVETLRQRRSQKLNPPENIQVKEGRWFIPVDYVRVKEVEEEAAAIALNRTVERGGWDNDLLVRILSEYADTAPAVLDATGYDTEDLARLLGEPPDRQFDAALLPDVGAGNLKESYLIYLTFPDEESFYSALQTLTFGDRDEHREGMRMAAVEGMQYLEQWRTACGT